MKKLFLCFLAVIMGGLLAFAGCAPSDTGGTEQTPGSGNGNQTSGSFSGIIPQELAEIPSSYYSEADEQGTLVELYYDTYESFSYEERSQPLNKRAIVYLPYGYS